MRNCYILVASFLALTTATLNATEAFPAILEQHGKGAEAHKQSLVSSLCLQACGSMHLYVAV